LEDASVEQPDRKSEYEAPVAGIPTRSLICVS
jgi:hypothetical protein